MLKQLRQTGLRLFLCLTGLSLSLSLAACLPETTSSDVLLPTVETTSQTSSSTTEPPVETSAPAGPELLALSDYLFWQSETDVPLAGGEWYDSTGVNNISGLSDIVLMASGTGSPTISSPATKGPVLTVRNSERITFRNIRFGFAESKTKADSFLIRLIDSRDIRFENCAFFGSAGSAVLLDSTEGVFFEDCFFYDLGDAPLSSGSSYIPSQIHCTNCTFETAVSGAMALNLHHSVFDRCNWIGRAGYAMPVAAVDQTELAAMADQQGSLPSLLKEVLAARIRHQADCDQQITVINNIFASDEVINLFSAMEQDVARILPDNTLDWSLTGQKLEDVKPGESLDPTLGLKLALRVKVESEAEQADRQLSYTKDDLLDDLKPLQSLASLLDPLIDGDIEITLLDQQRRPLLDLTIPLTELDDWVGKRKIERILADGRLCLINPDLIPARFMGRDSSGLFAASHLLHLLTDSWAIDTRPLILYPQGEPCLVSYLLDYLGTDFKEGVAYHRYQLSFSRALAQASQERGELQIIPLADFTVRADNGLKMFSGSDTAFNLFGEELRLSLSNLLNQPLTTDDDQELWPLSHWSGEAFDILPVFVLEHEARDIVIRSVYFDEILSPFLVELKLVREQNRWSRESSIIIGD